MSADSTADAGILAVRRELLRDRCDVTRPSALSGDLDPDTGLETEGDPVVVGSDVPCWMRLNSGLLNTDNKTAGDVVQAQLPTLSVDVTTRLFFGDIAVITASRDGSLIGRRFRVVGLPSSTFSVRHPYTMQEVTG